MALRCVSGCSSQPALSRGLSTTTSRSRIPLHMLSALSQARETEHFTKRSGLGVTNHTPALEAIKASEVDPFAPPKRYKQGQQHATPSPPPQRLALGPTSASGGPQKKKPVSTRLTRSLRNHADDAVSPPGPTSGRQEFQYRYSIAYLLMRQRHLVHGLDRTALQSTIKAILVAKSDAELPWAVQEQIAAARARDNATARAKRKEESSGDGSSGGSGGSGGPKDGGFTVTWSWIKGALVGAVATACLAVPEIRRLQNAEPEARRSHAEVTSALDKWSKDTETTLKNELQYSQWLMEEVLAQSVGVSTDRKSSWIGKLLWAKSEAT